MSDLFILVACLIWIPLIPLRIVLHTAVPVWRRLGDVSYGIAVVYWSVMDIFLLNHREGLLSARFESNPILTAVGIVIAVSFVLFGYWTVRTLGLVTLSTRPQISPDKTKASLIITGPYRWIRHPFYFTEWGVLLGLVLATSSWLLLVLLLSTFLLDPIVTWFEEKELLERFGEAYHDYQKKVPRLIPGVLSTKRLAVIGILTGLGAFGSGGSFGPGGVVSADPVRKKDGIRYMITGVGESKNDPATRSFSLKLVFASTDGALYGDVNARITDPAGKTVFEIFSDGPWLLVDLPKGSYRCAATDTRKISRSTPCEVGEGQKMYVLRWPPD